MKDFKFRLDTVKSYKENVLNELKREYQEILSRVNSKLLDIERLDIKIEETDSKFQKILSTGAPIEEFLLFSKIEDRLVKEKEKEKERLVRLRKLQEAKSQEIREADIDYRKYEKLKDKAFLSYQKELEKENETFIEEFIGNRK